MDEDLRLLSDALTIKERLRLLAEIQVAYLEQLRAHGLDQAMAEQLVIDWSRHAYSLTTTRERFAPSLDDEIGELLGSTDPSGKVAGDPSSVPPGEPWLKLVEDVEQPADDEADGDDADGLRAA